MHSKVKPIFGDSAETLRNKRMCTYSFAKASRFSKFIYKPSVDFVSLPSTLGRRGTSLGYGQRWQPDVRNKDTPSPGAYDINTILNSGHFGRHKDSISKNSEFKTDDVPGPGSYDISEPIGKNAPKISFRGKHCEVKYPYSPSPQAYSPSPSIQNSFRGTSFGFGGREFMKHVESDSPGPGCYDFTSTFHVSRKRKLKKKL